MSDSPSPQQLIEQAENDNQLRWDNERAILFLKAAKQFDQRGNKTSAENAQRDGVLFQLRRLDYKRKSGSKERFAPLYELNGVFYPDKKKFTKEQLEYYRKKAEELKNPVVRARYHDILWELERDHISARKAIDDYLACVPIYLKNEWESEVADSLTRAIELASNLNDQKKISAVKSAIFSTLEKMASTKKYRFMLEITDACLGSRKHITEEELLTFEKYLQDGVNYYRDEVKDGFHLERSFLEMLVELEKIVKKDEESKKHREEIAKSYETEAEWVRDLMKEVL